MPDITEAVLPGVGVRHEFVAANGQRVAVVSHRGGRREISVSRRDDPDAASIVLSLDADDAAALAAVLGAPQLATAVRAMQEVEGLVIDWVRVEDGSPAVGSTIGAGEYRTKTGVSIVAVLRDRDTIPAPDPSFAFQPGDVAVAVGTADGVAQLRSLLR